jgi:hypothetical protein
MQFSMKGLRPRRPPVPGQCGADITSRRPERQSQISVCATPTFRRVPYGQCGIYSLLELQNDDAGLGCTVM